MNNDQLKIKQLEAEKRALKTQVRDLSLAAIGKENGVFNTSTFLETIRPNISEDADGNTKLIFDGKSMDPKEAMDYLKTSSEYRNQFSSSVRKSAGGTSPEETPIEEMTFEDYKAQRNSDRI